MSPKLNLIHYTWGSGCRKIEERKIRKKERFGRDQKQLAWTRPGGASRAEGYAELHQSKAREVMAEMG